MNAELENQEKQIRKKHYINFLVKYRVIYEIYLSFNFFSHNSSLFHLYFVCLIFFIKGIFLQQLYFPHFLNQFNYLKNKVLNFLLLRF